MNWIWKTIIITVVVIILGIGIYKLWVQNRELESDIESLNATLMDIKEENQELERRIDYFKDPENLLKEVKSQFNYKKQGEKMIIVVPDENNE